MTSFIPKYLDTTTNNNPVPVNAPTFQKQEGRKTFNTPIPLINQSINCDIYLGSHKTIFRFFIRFKLIIAFRPIL